MNLKDSQLLFNIFQFQRKKKYLRYIIINKYLQNFYNFKNKDFLLLDDAVNIEFFKHKKNKFLKILVDILGALLLAKDLKLLKIFHLV